MLSELRARQLGVIEDLTLLLGPGMTAVTGETGAGKTMVVGALALLVGGRADPVLVRHGADEAVVEGRFCDGGSETVLSRAIAVQGRSRAYIDGRMVTAASLSGCGAALVDLHGQHAHQSLLSPSAQRAALDRFAGVSTARRDGARRRVSDLERQLAEAGGDRDAREREEALLRFQLDEIARARIDGPDEEERLREEFELLSAAGSHRAAATSAHGALVGDDQLIDRVGALVASLAGNPPLADAGGRLRSVAAELADIAEELRKASETLEEDPQRLAEVTERRSLLRELVRKYARAGSLADVLAWEEQARQRLDYLAGEGSRAVRLAEELSLARADLRAAAGELGAVRRGAAASFASAVEAELRQLAMPKARFAVSTGENVPVGEGDKVVDRVDQAKGGDARIPPVPGDELRELAADDVCFLLGANAGEALAPLSKVASGGELARAMLALRLVVLQRSGTTSAEAASGAPSGAEAQGEQPEGPGTLVFDEVDAGIGGEAAIAVGRALARLGERFQVLVVTHLAQVAAFAGSHVVVTKSEDGARTVSTAAQVGGRDRVVELARMLSGQPASKAAQRHAAELLSQASAGYLS